MQKICDKLKFTNSPEHKLQAKILCMLIIFHVHAWKCVSMGQWVGVKGRQAKHCRVHRLLSYATKANCICLFVSEQGAWTSNKWWRQQEVCNKCTTSIPVLPLNTRSLSIPHERHSVFLLPSRSVKKISWLSLPISKTHLGREMGISPVPFPPHSWNAITTFKTKTSIRQSTRTSVETKTKDSEI